MIRALRAFAEALRPLTTPAALWDAAASTSACPEGKAREAILDILSEVLRVVRLSGVIHFRGEFTQPWAFSTSPPALLAARLKVPEGSVTPFHVFVDGSCWVRLGTLPPVQISTGDVIILPRGDQHVLASHPDLPPVPINSIYAHPSTEQITVMRHGGAGEPSNFICGFLHADQQFDPLLKSLPSLICVRVRNGQLRVAAFDPAGGTERPIESQPEAEWWNASLRYLISESAMPGPGNRAVLARLAESLFVEVLRWQLRFAAQGRGGWLAALHDAQIGRVLALIHALPERDWTVDELAEEAAMSRAALGRRFVALVGQSPIHYLTSWRMHLARQLLQESKLSIGEIAKRVGYDSETAFNRAFHRVVGSPPVTWRLAQSHLHQSHAAPG